MYLKKSLLNKTFLLIFLIAPLLFSKAARNPFYLHTQKTEKKNKAPVVVGIILAKNAKGVLIRANRKTDVFYVGDKIAEYTIVEIREKFVIVKKDGEKNDKEKWVI